MRVLKLRLACAAALFVTALIAPFFAVKDAAFAFWDGLTAEDFRWRFYWYMLRKGKWVEPRDFYDSRFDRS